MRGTFTLSIRSFGDRLNLYAILAGLSTVVVMITLTLVDKPKLTGVCIEQRNAQHAHDSAAMLKALSVLGIFVVVALVDLVAVIAHNARVAVKGTNDENQST